MWTGSIQARVRRERSERSMVGVGQRLGNRESPAPDRGPLPCKAWASCTWRTSHEAAGPHTGSLRHARRTCHFYKSKRHLKSWSFCRLPPLYKCKERNERRKLHREDLISVLLVSGDLVVADVYMATVCYFVLVTSISLNFKREQDLYFFSS